MTKFVLLYHTIKHLTREQVFYRLLYLWRSRNPASRYVKKEKTPAKITFSPLNHTSLFLKYSFFSPEAINRGEFTFLNVTKSYSNAVDWKAPDRDRLWRYNLHYFQYLHPQHGLPVETGISLMDNWIKKNPQATHDAWDPFPVSLRLVNWLKYISTNNLDNFQIHEIVESAYLQTLWLEKRLEFHLLGNHLFKNIKALVFAGLFFQGTDAKRWLAKGLKLLHQEINEQILADGGHFERSPMYHSMILEDCLDLFNVLSASNKSGLNNPIKQLKSQSGKMIQFLIGMTHPDCRIALFNDAAFGIEPHPSDLQNYYKQLTGLQAAQPEPPTWSFPETGYYVMEPEKGNRLLVDCGRIGPDYLTGHAHCDILSFELSLKNERVIVDSGCRQYIDGEIRQYNRGNAGHNTLTIDGQNQSEVWGAHRCARRAYPLQAKLTRQSDGTLFFSGSHNGYTRLPGSPVHYRQIKWKGSAISIEDRVEGSGIHDIEILLHINPLFAVKLIGKGVTVIKDSAPFMQINPMGAGNIAIKTGWYCPEFGKQLECPVLSYSFSNVNLPFYCGLQIKIT